MDFLVSEQSLTARLGNQPVLASNSVKFTSLTFYFDGSWDGLLKTAYFHQDGLDTPIASILDSSGTCYLPNSLTAGKAWVGLSGHSSDGTKIGTTNKVMLVIHQSAYDDDAQAEVDPSPSLYAELLAQFEVYVGEAEGYAGDAESSASSASGSATSASSSASSASTSATNAATSETNAGISATNASASATNASTSATSAETSRQAIENMAVEASTGAAYSVATVTKTTDGGVVTLTFVIPKGDTGAPFYIAKTYSSVLEMNADYDGTDVSVNEFVMISTSSVEDEDNAKVYVKTDTSYQFVTDLSGAQGIQGQTGNGIVGINLTTTVGLVDTYTVTFTNGTSTTFTVTNGEKGDTGSTGVTGAVGNGISSITKTDASGLVDTYTVLFTNGSSTTFTVTNGGKGDKGDTGETGATGLTGATGNGISGIELTSTVGFVKTYTITFTDTSTTTFSVTDGEKGDTGDTGDTGAVYTPSVSSSGDLSWTNNGGLANPATVNIKGVKGDTGDAFTTEMTYVSVSAMNAGYATDGVSIGGYVIISPASTSDPDYGKVYQKGSTEYEYVITMAGATGNGISSLVKTSTSGLVDTYTISYTDGTSTTYTVTNGADGVDGANGTNGIDGSSAYEVAVENGYSGTEAQWLASLQATATVVNDTLTSASTTQALSANQGKVLNESLSNKVDSATHNLKSYTEWSQIGLVNQGEYTIEEIVVALWNATNDNAVLRLAVSHVNTPEILSRFGLYYADLTVEYKQENYTHITLKDVGGSTIGVMSILGNTAETYEEAGSAKLATDTDLSNKADASTHNLVTYTSLAQLGLTAPVSCQDIMEALSLNTTLSIYTSETDITDAPTSYGALICTKTSGQSGSFLEWIQTLNTGGAYYRRVYRAVSDPPLGDWQPYATATTPTEYALELAEGYSINDACTYAKTQENIVIVNLDFSGEFPVAVATLIAYLPSGYRPSEYIRGVVSGDGVSDVGRFSINPSTGSIYIKFQSAATSTLFGLGATFIAAP